MWVSVVVNAVTSWVSGDFLEFLFLQFFVVSSLCTGDLCLHIQVLYRFFNMCLLEMKLTLRVGDECWGEWGMTAWVALLPDDSGTRRSLAKWWHLILCGAFSFSMAGAERRINSSPLFSLSLLFQPSIFFPTRCMCLCIFFSSSSASIQLFSCFSILPRISLCAPLFSLSLSSFHFPLTILSFYHLWLSAAHICG